MKFSTLTSFALASALVAASPLPKVEFVTVTQYTTIQVNHAQYAAATKGNPANPETFLKASSATTCSSLSSPSAIAPASVPVTQATIPSVTPTAEQALPPAPTDTFKPSAAPVEDSPVEVTPVESAAVQSSSAAGSTSDGETFTGSGTFYDPEMGACGFKSKGEELVVAMNKELFDQYTPNGNPNKNTLCGKKINAHYGGKTVQVTVVDRCVGCGVNGLDLSPTAFSKIADKDLGRIKVSWEWAS